MRKNKSETPDIYNSYHNTPECIELNKSHLDYSIHSSKKEIRQSISSRVRSAFYDYTYKTKIQPGETLIFNFRENSLKFEDKEKKEHPRGAIPQSLYDEVFKINKEFNFILGEIFNIIANSGYHIYHNITIEDMEKSIKNLIDESYNYRNSDISIENKINNITFQDIHGLKKIKNNEVSMIWASKYKGPLYEMISQYYWLKFNPELSVQKTLLDTIGFKPCKRCFSLRNN